MESFPLLVRHHTNLPAPGAHERQWYVPSEVVSGVRCEVSRSCILDDLRMEYEKASEKEIYMRCATTVHPLCTLTARHLPDRLIDVWVEWSWRWSRFLTAIDGETAADEDFGGVSREIFANGVKASPT